MKHLIVCGLLIVSDCFGQHAIRDNDHVCMSADAVFLRDQRSFWDEVNADIHYLKEKVGVLTYGSARERLYFLLAAEALSLANWVYAAAALIAETIGEYKLKVKPVLYHDGSTVLNAHGMVVEEVISHVPAWSLLSSRLKALIFFYIAQNLPRTDEWIAKTSLVLGAGTNVGHTLAYRPDGQRIAITSGANTVALWNPVTGHKESDIIIPGITRVQHLAYSPNGERLAIAAPLEQQVLLWNIPRARLDRVLAYTDSLTWPIYSSNGKFLATVAGKQVLLWNIEAGKVTKQFQGQHAPLLVNVMAYSPNGMYIATGSNDGGVHVWNAWNGALEYILGGHTAQIRSLAFSPDSAVLASGADNGQLFLWSMCGGGKIGELGHEAHNNGSSSDAVATSALAYSPDGKHLVTGADDGSVCVWSLQHKKIEHVFIEDSRVCMLSYSPASDRLAVATEDGAVRVWTLSYAYETIVNNLPILAPIIVHEMML